MLPCYEVYRLAHHRAWPVTGYCRIPRVNARWDGTAVIFSSNMSTLGEGQACGYSDLYLIDVGKAP